MKRRGKEVHVLYEDSHLLALYKPHGLLTQPSPICSLSLETKAKEWIKQRDQKKGNVFLEAVHRLDRPVSGIALFAKSQKALKRLMQQIREKQVKKFYLAWVEGELRTKKGTLTHFLHKRGRRSVVSKRGKRSILTYSVQEIQKGNTKVRIQLLTGRYHQIRAQFAAIGHPVMGDTRYGAKGREKEGKIFLSHVEMVCTHPTKKEEIQVFADPGWDL